MGEGWIRPAQSNSSAKAVLQACDKADGAEDLLVLDPVGCKAKIPAGVIALRGRPRAATRA
jgi:feruloyl esterase